MNTTRASEVRPQRLRSDTDRLVHAVPLTAAGWLAATGATLLLVASVVVVAGQWSGIGPTARFAGLVGSLVATFAAAEAARSRMRSTATSLAVLAACLTAPVAIAAAAALDAQWPTCVMVGGLAALVAVNVQARRWDVQSLRAAPVGAVGLAAFGTAATSSVPLSLLLAGASTGALVVGARRRSVALAGLVPIVPLSTLLARAGVGPGTLHRVDAIGVESWVIPTSCILAAATVAVSAHRRGNAALASASLFLVAYGLIGGAVVGAAPLALWCTAPAVLVGVVQVLAVGDTRSIFARWSELIREVTASTLAIVALLAPFIVASTKALEHVVGGGSMSRQFMVPASATVAALAVAAVVGASSQRSGRLVNDLVRVGAVGALLAAMVSSGISGGWCAAGALGLWAVSSSVTSWGSWIGVCAAHATWATFLMLLADATRRFDTVIIVGAASIVILAAWSNTNDSIHRCAIPSATIVSTLLLITRWPADRSTLWAVLLVATPVITAAAMRIRRVGPTDVLAVSLGASTLLVALFTTPAAISLSCLVLASQGWLYAVAGGRVRSAAIAAAGAGCSAVSIWWTTGTNGLVISWLAPHGIDGQDLTIAAVSAGLVVAGTALRSTRSTSSWLAYGPGLSMLLAWLAVSQVAADGGWAASLGVSVAVVCVAVGGVRRLGAPLVLGTASLVATLVTSAGPRLATAPTWSWIAAGGVSLLVISAMMERPRRPLLKPAQRTDDDEQRESIATAFQREFV
ncbi:MAG: SCO7613 C-terminal domain-containing membrane protein [Ilumatobacter sp.]